MEGSLNLDFVFGPRLQKACIIADRDKEMFTSSQGTMAPLVVVYHIAVLRTLLLVIQKKKCLQVPCALCF